MKKELTFFHVAEYDDVHDTERPGESDIVRYGKAFLINQPAPPEFFNRDLQDPDTIIEMGRTIYAPLSLHSAGS